MIAHGRFFVEDSKGHQYKWDVANGYPITVIEDDYQTDSYVMGGSKPICWRTAYTNGVQDGDNKKIMSCPTGTLIEFVTAKPQNLGDKEEIDIEYKLTIKLSTLSPSLASTKLSTKEKALKAAVSSVTSSDDYHIPHANVHSCLSSINEPCYPFVANEVGLSTHR